MTCRVAATVLRLWTASDICCLAGYAFSQGGKGGSLPRAASPNVEELMRGLKGPLHLDTARAVFREVQSAATALVKPLRVAFVGPAGTFSHQAALQLVRWFRGVRRGEGGGAICCDRCYRWY